LRACPGVGGYQALSAGALVFALFPAVAEVAGVALGDGAPSGAP